MTVFLDDQPVNVAPDANLGQVLGVATEQLMPGGRIVVEVKVDGQTVAGDELQNRCEQSVADVEVHMVSADPRSLAADTLEQVRQGLGDAKYAQAEAADHLQMDHWDLACEQILGAVQLWQHVQTAVQQTLLLLSDDLANTKHSGKSVTEHVGALAEQLKALIAMIKDRDTVAMADALAYEWPETNDTWDGLLTALVDRLRG